MHSNPEVSNRVSFIFDAAIFIFHSSKAYRRRSLLPQ